MYKIIKDGTTIGLTEFLTYIKQHDNGCFVLCPEPEASGIAFDGKVYHLLGREALEGVSTIMLEEVDAGSEITKAKEMNGIVFVTLAEAGSIDDAKHGASAITEGVPLFGRCEALCAPTTTWLAVSQRGWEAPVWGKYRPGRSFCAVRWGQQEKRLTLLCTWRSTSARSAGSFQGLALTLFLPQMRAGDADFSQFAPEP